MFRCIAIMALLMCAYTMQAASDSVREKQPMIRVGVDISKLALPLWNADYRAFVFQLDKAIKPDVCLALDAGWGQSTAQTDALQYSSNNTFMAVGVDKTFFERLFAGDRDNASIGVRYGLAPIRRSAATYTINDPVWGAVQGQIPEKRFMAHWFELCGGFRMEIAHHIFMGWTVRAKTLINPNTVRELPPAYLVGFGRGEKNPAFDYNLYLMVGLGKRVKKIAPTAKK
jgi:hypothetical protein